MGKKRKKKKHQPAAAGGGADGGNADAAALPAAASEAGARLDRYAVWGTAAGAFLLYALTCCPTTPPGDAGELISAAWTLGVAHPPGYPIYTFAGWIWSHLIPFGEVAWRLSLFSAAAMAAATGLVVAAARRLGVSRVAAVAGALALAVAWEPWRAATGAEVFALHATFVAAVLWLALRWRDGDRPPYVPALVLGLSGAHHQTAILLVPALAVWAWWHRERFGAQPGRAVAGCVGLAVAGLLPYLLLLWTGTREHALVWGNTTTLFDPTEPVYQVVNHRRIEMTELGEGLWHHVLRGAYGAQLGAAQGGGLLDLSPREWVANRAAWLWNYAASGLGGLWLAAWVGAPMGAWALWQAGGARRRALGLLGLAWAFSGPLFIAYGVNFRPDDALRQAVVARFYVMPAVPLALLAAAGIDAAQRWWGHAAGWGAAAAAVGLAFLPATGWFGNTPAPLVGNRAFGAYGRDLLASAPRDALVFVRGDSPTNAIDALQYCERLRPDVAAMSQLRMSYPWGTRRAERRFGIDVPGPVFSLPLVTTAQLIDANQGARPICFFGFDPRDTSHTARYHVVPHGLLDRVVPKTETLDLVQVYREGLALLQALHHDDVLAAPDDAYFGSELRAIYAGAFVRLGVFLHTGGDQGSAGPPRVDLARTVYEAGLQRFPDHPPLLKNFGLALTATGEPEKAKPYYRRYLRLRPDDPQAPAIAQAAGVPWPPAKKR